MSLSELVAKVNWHQRHQLEMALGDQIADKVTAFLGSWRFIILQTFLMAVWVVWNTVVAVQFLAGGGFDPFPFVFLNLFMSAEAAYSTPFIMMSQNRQAARDRAQAEQDHLTIQYLRDELEILKTMNARQLQLLALLTGKEEDDTPGEVAAVTP